MRTIGVVPVVRCRSDAPTPDHLGEDLVDREVALLLLLAHPAALRPVAGRRSGTLRPALGRRLAARGPARARRARRPAGMNDLRTRAADGWHAGPAPATVAGGRGVDGGAAGADWYAAGRTVRPAGACGTARRGSPAPGTGGGLGGACGAVLCDGIGENIAGAPACGPTGR